jgi:hypothetical protein
VSVSTLIVGFIGASKGEEIPVKSEIIPFRAFE